MDGAGLGPEDPKVNPFAKADMPSLRAALGGRRLLAASAPCAGADATLVAIDANLDMPGDPQSATGQAALLTGRNVPAEVGEHYGPKPHPAVAAALHRGSVFTEVLARGGTAALLNAYPPRYFDTIASGRRLYSSIPMAVTDAGIPLRTADDLRDGVALSADFTRQVDMAWFDFWPSDVAGHRADLAQAVELLERFDQVLGGLLEAWRDGPDLAIITSDHGNLEDLSERGHTRNPVPGILIGPADLRAAVAPRLRRLTDFHDVILEAIFGR